MRIKQLLFVSILAILPIDNIYGQDIVFASRSLSTGRMIREIERQAMSGFAFDVATFDTTRIVTLSSRTLPLIQALEQMLHESNFTYKIKNRYIVLYRKPPKLPDLPKIEKDSVARTGDIYRLTDHNKLKTEPLRRSYYEPEIIFDTMLTYEKRVPPDPYSSYEPLMKAAMEVPQRQTPKLFLKTNLVYDLAWATPNIAAEYRIGRQGTIALSIGLNQWNAKPTLESDRKLLHLTILPEYRYWLCEPFVGHAIGGHLLYGRYNISSRNVPMLFEDRYRYDGHAAGVGITYGYHLPLSRVVGLEFGLGAGAVYMNYDRFSCKLCSKNGERFSKFYFGPTRLAVNLVFMIK